MHNMGSGGKTEKGFVAMGYSFIWRILLWVAAATPATCSIAGFLIPAYAQVQQDLTPGRVVHAIVPSVRQAVDPHPLEGDLELPMPCGAKLVLRHVCVPADGYFGDLQAHLGCKDCGRVNQSYMDGKRREGISGPFTLEDLPESWRKVLTELAERGDGRCPKPGDAAKTGFYYFVGKYEISVYQWRAVMEKGCSGGEDQLSIDDPRPKTGISWFEAMEFTRRYTEWLLRNAPDSLPAYSNNRYGYVRLPTEGEWEYAARGGHVVTEAQLNDEEFFPVTDRPLGEYAVFTDLEGTKPPEKMAWIGSKKPNPLGLFDTAGNAAEMLLEPFRFSVGFRLHGTAGGFVVKGGSYLKGKDEIMPGRREEQPFYLGEGAFRGSDLGLRVVLSGIVTPEDRREALDRQWAEVGEAFFKAQEGFRSAGLGIEMDRSKDPISEIDRLLAVSVEEQEKRNLLYLREVLRQQSVVLAEQKVETVKGVIRSALFTAESLLNYALRREVVTHEINRLEKMKTETVSRSVLEALDNGILRAKETVRMLDAAISHFVNFYMDRVRESQRYPQEMLESQMAMISSELSLGDGFGRSLRDRLDTFKKHVAFYKAQGGNLSREILQLDLLSAISR